MKFILKSIMILGMITLIIHSSCKKDEDTTAENNNGDGFRLKEWKYYENGVFYVRAVFSYANQKVTAVNYYDTQDASGDIILKKTVEYAGNEATIIEYYTTSNGNFEIWDKTVIIYEGSNMIEVKGYDYEGGGFILQRRVTFVYDNNFLVEMNEYSGNNLYQYPWLRTVFTYSNGKVTERKNYQSSNNVLKLYSKTILEYIDSKLSEETTFLLGEDWKEYSKTEYTYQGNVYISKYYENISGSWELKDEYETTFDDNGNQIKWVYSDSYGNMNEMLYYYEAGSGNSFELMLGPPPGILKTGFRFSDKEYFYLRKILKTGTPNE